MTTIFDEKNFVNDAQFVCETDLAISFSKNGNITTTFVASTTNKQYVQNSISTIFEAKLRNFQKATRFRWQHFFLTERILRIMIFFSVVIRNERFPKISANHFLRIQKLVSQLQYLSKTTFLFELMAHSKST